MKNLFQSRNLVLGIATVGINLAVISPPAMAFSLTWTLDNASFVGGGTASGSFVFDTVDQTYSNINISTTANDPFLGGTYNDTNNVEISDGSNASSLILSLPNQKLTLKFDEPLTNSGGTRLLVVDGTPPSQEQQFAPGATRDFTSGNNVSAIPFEFSPTAGIILSLCLFGLPILKNKLT